MTRAISRILVALSAASVLCLAPPSVASGPASGAPAKKDPGRVTVIQAVPGSVVDVKIDGKSVAEGSEVGSVLGPFPLKPGEHTVSFRDEGSMKVVSELQVASGSSTDLVLHLPADPGGDPVVHSYAEPTGAIGPAKARVVLAHTATVAPADVRVNGQTVFTNIANGEFAEAELPAGSNEVALLPTGETSDPILGPVDVSLDSSTLSMIYAYGNPSDGSMNVISHTVELSDDGTTQPTTIDTGSAGLAAGAEVTTFSGSPAGDRHPATLTLLAGAACVLLALVLRPRGASRRLRG
ncbi:DUF4397 domain-containing protein [Nocardioides currus]|nr:DUF4397 domain-containing protein [Nocardioides currus]